MFLMDCTYIKREKFTDCDKNSTWNLLHAYIYSHSQRLIDEYPGYGLQDITRFQSQCAKMIFSKQIRYNRLFQKLIQKGG